MRLIFDNLVGLCIMQPSLARLTVFWHITITQAEIAIRLQSRPQALWREPFDLL